MKPTEDGLEETDCRQTGGYCLNNEKQRLPEKEQEENEQMRQDLEVRGALSRLVIRCTIFGYE